jgi:hypothetical protein
MLRTMLKDVPVRALLREWHLIIEPVDMLCSPIFAMIEDAHICRAFCGL